MLQHSIIALAVTLKVLALSERVLQGNPLLAENLLRYHINITVDKSSASSSWTAWVTQHVNRLIDTYVPCC